MSALVRSWKGSSITPTQRELSSRGAATRTATGSMTRNSRKHTFTMISAAWAISASCSSRTAGRSSSEHVCSLAASVSSSSSSASR